MVIIILPAFSKLVKMDYKIKYFLFVFFPLFIYIFILFLILSFQIIVFILYISLILDFKQWQFVRKFNGFLNGLAYMEHLSPSIKNISKNLLKYQSFYLFLQKYYQAINKINNSELMVYLYDDCFYENTSLSICSNNSKLIRIKKTWTRQ